MTDLPQEAIEAAIQAFVRHGKSPWATVTYDHGTASGFLLPALEAAAPHIAATERERIRHQIARAIADLLTDPEETP